MTIIVFCTCFPYRFRENDTGSNRTVPVVSMAGRGIQREYRGQVKLTKYKQITDPKWEETNELLYLDVILPGADDKTVSIP